MKMMKRIAALASAAVMACSAASAVETGMEGLTFEQLILAQQLVILQIMKRPEWKEVTVPAGVYQIGVEIPAGKWHIAPVAGQTAYINYGTELDALGTGFISRYEYQQITDKKASYYKYNQVEFVEWDLKDGFYIIIERAPVVFTRYIGPSFSFD